MIEPDEEQEHEIEILDWNDFKTDCILWSCVTVSLGVFRWNSKEDRRTLGLDTTPVTEEDTLDTWESMCVNAGFGPEFIEARNSGVRALHNMHDVVTTNGKILLNSQTNELKALCTEDHVEFVDELVASGYDPADDEGTGGCD